MPRYLIAALVAALIALAGSPYAAAQATCSTSLQNLVNAAAPGSVLTVPACVYRETVTINKPLTIDGQGAAEIRGSDVWAAWTPAGATWVSANAVPQLGDETPYLYDGRCGPTATPTQACVHREQVFSDGQPVSFSLDAARHVILISDPSGHVLEVTVRARWLRTASSNVTIRGFTMRHAASPLQTGAASNDGYDDWTISDSVLRDTHAAPIELLDGVRARVLRNDISGGGEMGIGGRTTGALIEANTIHDNGTLVAVGWGAAGIKLGGSSDTTIDGNDVYANPFGVWCDVGCHDFRVLSNRIHDNTQAGVLFEISDGATIQSNSIWSNGWGWQSWLWGAGILIQSSANANVSGNVLAWNYAGISVPILTRPDRPASLAGNVVRDNTIVRTIDPAAGFWGNQLVASGDDSAGADSRLYPADLRGNWFWADRPETYPPVRFSSANAAYWQLAPFLRAIGDTTSRYLTDAEANARLTAAGVPTGAIPAQVSPPTSTPTPTVTLVPTSTPTATPTQTATVTPTQTASPMPTLSLTRTPTPVTVCKTYVLPRGPVRVCVS